MGKASTRAQNRYIAKAYDRINLTVVKGQKENIQAHAAAHSESVNGFIGRAINEAMARDGVGDPQEAAGEALPQFMARAVSETAERDRLSRDS